MKEDYIPYPQQCIWFEQGRITNLRTRNNDMRQDFESVDIIALTDDDQVLGHFNKDILGASPNPGFDVVIEGKIFAHNITFALRLKVKGMFSPPRTSGTHMNNVGLNCELYNETTQECLDMRCFVRLGHRDDRWTLLRCYFFEPPKT